MDISYSQITSGLSLEELTGFLPTSYVELHKELRIISKSSQKNKITILVT